MNFPVEHPDEFNQFWHLKSLSNLVTIMSVENATVEETSRISRHILVILDRTKTDVDWSNSDLENDIFGLRVKYQKLRMDFDPTAKRLGLKNDKNE